MSARKRVSLKRTLSYAKRRGLELAALRPSDYRWLYAGYKKGVFDEPGVPKDMMPPEFADFVPEVTGSYSNSLVLKDKDEKTLALILVSRLGHVVEARTYHMPWSSDRDKIAGAVMFFAGLGDSFLAIKYCHPDEVKYCDHLALYWVLKRAGKIKSFYRHEEEQQDAIIYHSTEVTSPWVEVLKLNMRNLLADH